MQNPTATQACAVCKYQRRKCSSNCLLAPFFPANRRKDFLNTRRLFGVRNIIKLIENLSFQQRVVAVKTIVFEANVRAADPVGGCYKYMLELNKQIARYQAELNLVNQQLAICKAQSMFTQCQQQQPQPQPQTAQKQKQVVGNYDGEEEEEVNSVVDDPNSESFNIFDVDDHRYFSSFMSAYHVFDSNPVKFESDPGKHSSDIQPMVSNQQDRSSKTQSRFDF
ncbi:hypothetical protein V6N13_081443 [Hibiscus sabdariffa]|uniref:Uncharacterized protein n=2 Tax=Hibiscus sabdariffa TaxID=183260 RepID=A0ABR2DC76_9ROSI